MKLDNHVAGLSRHLPLKRDPTSITTDAEGKKYDQTDFVNRDLILRYDIAVLSFRIHSSCPRPNVGHE
jgi:hypothetical protein